MSDFVIHPDFSREDLRGTPIDQRLRYVEKIRIFYPRWQTILTKIRRCHERQPYAAEPPCLLLLGPLGVGKSTLIQSYVARYPATLTERGKSVTVLHATIPSRATVKNLLSALLAALGDPRAASGTIGGMTLRLQGFIRDCGIQLIILDELQHFFDQESQKILLNVSNWLKTLIKETGVACVLVGLKGEAEQVVNANPQLARLFGDPYILAPFQWINEKSETIVEFRTFLSQLEHLLPLSEPSNLADYERAWRCFVACEGIMAYLMALVREATEYALLNGQESLDDILLSQAFNERLAGERRDIPNPFIGSLPLPKSPTIVESAGSSNNATTKRGKPSIEKPPRVSDIVRS